MPKRKFKPIPPLTEKTLALFWAKVDKSGGPDSCWPWTAWKNEKGYGGFGINCRIYLAHRVALFLKTGIDPMELRSLHSCDNPPCCNGKHLFAGTDADNTYDMYRKGRQPSGVVPPELRPKGISHGSHKLSEDDVRAIRSRFSGGESQSSLATAFGICRSQISTIVHRKQWTHID